MQLSKIGKVCAMVSLLMLTVLVGIALTDTCDADGATGSTCDATLHSYSLASTSNGSCSGGHSYCYNYAVSATCTKSGYKAHWDCLVCGELFTEDQVPTTWDALVIPATGHSYSPYTITKAATCTEDGIKTRTCSVCNATETQTIAATGHDLVWTPRQAPTCTESGYELSCDCLTCGGLFTADLVPITWDALEIPATGHCYGSWTTTKAATCTEEGSQTRACSVCNATETQTIAATGHSTVTFDMAGGQGTVSEQRVAAGKTVPVPAEPTKEGFVFDGWYLDGEEFDFSTAITSDITLTAHWKAAPSGSDDKGDAKDDDKGDAKGVLSFVWIVFALLAVISVVTLVMYGGLRCPLKSLPNPFPGGKGRCNCRRSARSAPWCPC